MSALDDLQARMMEMDARLRPIARRPVDVTRPGWLGRLQRQPPPLDEAGIRGAAERLLDDLIVAYAEGTEETREAVRRLFAQHRSFAWAATLSDPPSTIAGFRRRLVLLSMKDQGSDGRDALVTLQETCAAAKAGGVALEPTLRAVAAMSSRVNRHGMGSTSDMLLRQCPTSAP